MLSNTNTYYQYLKMLANILEQYEHSERPYNIAIQKFNCQMFTAHQNNNIIFISLCVYYFMHD